MESNAPYRRYDGQKSNAPKTLYFSFRQCNTNSDLPRVGGVRDGKGPPKCTVILKCSAILQCNTYTNCFQVPPTCWWCWGWRRAWWSRRTGSCGPWSSGAPPCGSRAPPGRRRRTPARCLQFQFIPFYFPLEVAHLAGADGELQLGACNIIHFIYK